MSENGAEGGAAIFGEEFEEDNWDKEEKANKSKMIAKSTSIGEIGINIGNDMKMGTENTIKKKKNINSNKWKEGRVEFINNKKSMTKKENILEKKEVINLNVKGDIKIIIMNILDSIR